MLNCPLSRPYQARLQSRRAKKRAGALSADQSLSESQNAELLTAVELQEAADQKEVELALLAAVREHDKVCVDDCWHTTLEKASSCQHSE